MSESKSHMSADMPAQQGASPGPQPGAATPGQQLRQAREAAGLHVEAMAGMFKVPVHKLEALEADDYAAFQDTVFMRALASSLCRSLGLEAGPMLEQLPRSTAKGFGSGSMPLNAPIKARAGNSGGGMTPASGVSRKAVGAVLALLIGAAVVYFLPRGAQDAETASTTTSVTSVTPPVQTAAALAPAAATLPQRGLEQEQGPAAAAPAPAPVQSDSLESAVSPQAQVPPDTDSPALVFSATAPSWVQVKNAHGTVVLEKSLAAGESLPVSAALPLSVVVGRVDVTSLQVRGQAFDLAAVARANVARFEVK